MMVPGARRKLQNFIQKHEGAIAVNPHAPGSPPLQAVTQTAGPAASPLISRLDRQAAADALNPMQVSKPSGLGESVQLSLGPPQADDLIERQRNDGGGAMPGWESVPEELHEEGGLREQWDEQSNINSLFSESELVRPASSQYPNHHGDHEDDASSDVVDNRQPPRRGRNAHRSAESAPIFEYQNGQLVVPSVQGKGFSTSMITHAPTNPRADAPRFRRNPFGSTSDESSPRPQREPSFLHSAFPVRGTEELKRPPRFERSSLPKETSRRISPEKYNNARDAIQPDVYFPPAKEFAPGARRPTGFQTIGNPALDWDADDSDIHSQGDDFPDQDQQHTPKATRQRVVPDDATVVLNPPKPVVAQKPQKTVTIQDDALLGSPIREALLGQRISPAKKRLRGIDYDEEVLRKMNFADLQNEPFDHDPTRQVITSPAKPPANNLNDRLEFYRSKDEESQGQLFTQMAVREWDDSGDWFLERFSNIVTKMKEARQAKRKIVEQYETQISEREEEVRRKKENIDRKLSKLKHDSSAMLKGSESSD
ncbi:hypothetical protein J7T55_010131 [Diaporthe amygdali]|uniref:uncharacterized protein n=1 Tax=Phomopsis amygdali TaxID=1214568 RepID=UPI0022FDC083|nr:uncharacterized protein J7T55_010131 [Diaporthe amygdali]KAJ0113887.1 hypothetical protein J7T55_010131 [Diaporthe amygdali]